MCTWLGSRWKKLPAMQAQTTRSHSARRQNAAMQTGSNKFVKAWVGVNVCLFVCVALHSRVRAGMRAGAGARARRCAPVYIYICARRKQTPDDPFPGLFLFFNQIIVIKILYFLNKSAFILYFLKYFKHFKLIKIENYKVKAYLLFSMFFNF